MLYIERSGTEDKVLMAPQWVAERQRREYTHTEVSIHQCGWQFLFCLGHTRWDSTHQRVIKQGPGLAKPHSSSYCERLLLLNSRADVIPKAATRSFVFNKSFVFMDFLQTVYIYVLYTYDLLYICI